MKLIIFIALLSRNKYGLSFQCSRKKMKGSHRPASQAPLACGSFAPGSGGRFNLTGRADYRPVTRDGFTGVRGVHPGAAGQLQLQRLPQARHALQAHCGGGAARAAGGRPGAQRAPGYAGAAAPVIGLRPFSNAAGVNTICRYPDTTNY